MKEDRRKMWARENPERVKERQKKWREAHREQVRKINRDWYRAHQAEQSERVRLDRLANPEKYRQRYRAYKDKHAQHWRSWKLRHEYGIDIEEYDQILEVQRGVCAICHRTGSSKRRTRLVVDHDHETGKVRGLLCDGCNRALGLLKDNADVLRSAAEYVEQRKCGAISSEVA